MCSCKIILKKIYEHVKSKLLLKWKTLMKRYSQKQPFPDVLQNRCKSCIFIKKRLQHRCFLWILRNFYEQFFTEHLYKVSASRLSWINRNKFNRTSIQVNMGNYVMMTFVTIRVSFVTSLSNKESLLPKNARYKVIVHATIRYSSMEVHNEFGCFNG